MLGQFTPQREYTVYGITVFGGHLWFMLCGDDHGDWPYPAPPALFEVIDHRLSRYWKCGIRVVSVPPPAYRQLIEDIAFPEWCDDALFWERLVHNMEPEAMAIFARYKALMDAEFPVSDDVHKNFCDK